MHKNLFMPLKLQFFAEQDNGGQGGNSDQNTGDIQSNQQNQSTGIDYDKIQSMIETATAKKENAVLKSYFQQQGMTEEEAKQAMETYKANKQQHSQQQQVDTSALQTQLQQAQEMASKAEIDKLATIEALGLGIDSKSLPYVLKMADLSTVKDKDGKVSNDAIKEAINKVLEDVPALKPSQQGNGGFQIGGSGQQDQQQSSNDDVRKLFGLKPKN